MVERKWEVELRGGGNRKKGEPVWGEKGMGGLRTVEIVETR